MKRLSIFLLALGLPAATIQAAEPLDEAYLAFKNARSEAAWIASGADHPLADSAFRPIPELSSFPSNPAKRDLGFVLFHDARLSRDGTVSCTSCHMGMLGGTDNQALSRGIGGQLGSLNSPTVFNSAFNFRQFWDGRAVTLDEQALGPITNPVEMGHDLESVVSFVSSDANYANQFNEIYPDGVTAANIGNAIAQHTRDMTRTDSRFNAFLKGERSALNEQEQRGWERFQAVGCASCHNGINLGGNSYQRVSNTMNYFGSREAKPADDGIYARSGREQDLHVFKTPTLNNVAMTAPYFHDGSVRTLTEAVQQMGELQAGRNLNQGDVTDIVAFLHTLSSDFFANRAQGMSQEAMQGEMRNQLQQMNHQNHHGGMPGRGPMPKMSDDTATPQTNPAPSAQQMQHGGAGVMHNSNHHQRMSAPLSDSGNSQHGGDSK